ncbi:hypothetical protein BDV96DRAFT_494457 [Lophiotrema nucula]|uniref:RRM domain-containing protein n=1 Tax=Lophiotrema nucula TaxID=690887 RepID=A0A6A5Z6G3_9PLEO|nr:hypothetical protein BDV96DRAFT_494457 [Lophiotrema nucula]
MSRSVEAVTSNGDPELKKKKKSKKESKTREAVVNAESSPEPVKSKKRKREALPDEIEVDVDLPEPLSKKALRRAKKGKPNPPPATADDSDAEEKPSAEKSSTEKKAAQRSEFGVWIGNLPWSATADTLKAFLASNSDITAEQITRIHMPAPTKPPNPRWTTKPLNRGFAYVDFDTQLAMYSAIALTETKMDGRPLLIKNAKNFEGRPEKPKEEETADKNGKPPNKRVFVGNLGFDVTKEDLTAHFGQCGELADIHMATFEDSGKCKGYAWVTFEDIEAAKSAVKGYIFKEGTSKKSKKDDSDEEVDRGKKGKQRKWLLNKLQGRELRCEFAEDATTRYNKRHGKEKPAHVDGMHPDRMMQFDEDAEAHTFDPKAKQKQRQKQQWQPKGANADPRSIKPGAAHTNAPRASHAIVESKGKKITFE